MKKLLFLFFVFTGCISYTLQQLPEPGVYQFPGKTKNEIYQKIQQWLAANFMRGGDTIQYKNLEEGRIIAQGACDVFHTPFGLQQRIGYWFVWTIDIKDGRVRVAISNIDFSPVQKMITARSLGASSPIPPYTDWSKKNVDDKMNELIQDMSDYILGKTDKNIKNW